MGAIFAILSPFLGIIGSLLPSVMRLFERKQEIQYDLQLQKIKGDQQAASDQVQYNIENVKADVAEGQSLRDHDKSLDGGSFINAMRASIRPVLTYAFFLVFVAVKLSAATVMLASGDSVPTMLDAVWNLETSALFSTIIAFWFGARTIENMYNRRNQGTIRVGS